jgi:protein-L-isoaspartate(D-aspartate) O-methyltransferase
VCLLLGGFVAAGHADTETPVAATTARRRMVAADIAARGIRDPCVLRAMGRVPRERFVPARWREQAYGDHPLPIGAGQTISQPYIVAVMTEAAALHGRERVLEVGTGSGYQAAILADCAREVFTIEIVAELARSARARLEELGYANVRVREGDGRAGWPAHAPYDAIIVTAAGPEVPPALVEQLREGGVLVIPRGAAGGRQVLLRGRKTGGRLEWQELMDVSFVPLVERPPTQGADGAGTERRPSSGPAKR